MTTKEELTQASIVTLVFTSKMVREALSKLSQTLSLTAYRNVCPLLWRSYERLEALEGVMKELLSQVGEPDFTTYDATCEEPSQSINELFRALKSLEVELFELDLEEYKSLLDAIWQDVYNLIPLIRLLSVCLNMDMEDMNRDASGESQTITTKT